MTRFSICFGPRPVALLVVVLSPLVMGACQSMSPESGRLPAVEVSGVYLDEIETACDEVFYAEGYHHAVQSGRTRGYERTGSNLQELAYGSWFDRRVLERVLIHIRNLGADSYVLECEPLIVNRAGSNLEQKRHRSGMKRGTYQRLLARIKDRLEN